MKILLSDGAGGDGGREQLYALRARLEGQGHEVETSQEGDWDVEVVWIGDNQEAVVRGTPVLACGVGGGGERASRAVEAGADDYIAHDSETAEWEVRLQVAQARRRVRARRAGALAHDFNNVLAAIRGNADLAMMSAALPEAARVGLGKILEAVDGADELMGRLHGEARAQRVRGAVLVADGRDGERRAAAAALKRAGYVVFEAGTSEEALEVSREVGSALDAMVLELGLAGGEAGRLLGEMRARRPGLRVVAWGEPGQGGEEMLLIERAPLAEDLPLLVEHALGA